MEQTLDCFDDVEVSISAVAKSITPKLIRYLNYKNHKKFRRQKKRQQLNKNNQKIVNFQTVQEPAVRLFKNQEKYNAHQIKGSKNDKKEIFINGNKVYGRLHEGQIHGKTEIMFANGSFFKGKYKNGTMLSGIFKFKNGMIYQGGFLSDKFYGQGTLKFTDGKQISGDWSQQKILGNGQIKYPNGQIYYGQINNLKKHGFGYLFLIDGSKYVGEFKQGRIEGKGSYFKNEVLVGEGRWENGQLMEALPLQNYQFGNICCSGVRQVNQEDIKLSAKSHKTNQSRLQSTHKKPKHLSNQNSTSQQPSNQQNSSLSEQQYYEQNNSTYFTKQQNQHKNNKRQTPPLNPSIKIFSDQEQENSNYRSNESFFISNSVDTITFSGKQVTVQKKKIT